MDWWPSVHSGLLHQPNLNHSPPISLPSSLLFLSLCLSHTDLGKEWNSLCITSAIQRGTVPFHISPKPSLFPFLCSLHLSHLHDEECLVLVWWCPYLSFVWCCCPSLVQFDLTVHLCLTGCFFPIVFLSGHPASTALWQQFTSSFLHSSPSSYALSLTRSLPFSLFSPRATPPLPRQVWFCIDHFLYLLCSYLAAASFQSNL